MAKNLQAGLRQSMKASKEAGLSGDGVFSRAPLDLRFAQQKTLDPRVTFTRASSGTYVGSDGLIQTATTNEPRFDHNPTTGESLGLLVEEARTNLLLQSESIDNVTNWNKVVGGTGSTPVVNANSVVAPDGTTTADQVILALNGGTTVNDSSYITQSYSSTSGTTYVVSIWLRTASGNVIISLDADSQNANTITVTPVWQRFSCARTTTSTASRTVRFGLRGTFSTADSATFYAWGAQLEAGAFPTSYIPTTTATVTRAADVASITGSNFSSFYNQTEGTVFANYAERAFSVTHQVATVSNGTANERISLAINPSNILDVGVISGGTDTFGGNTPTLTAQEYKIGFGYKADNSGVSANGSAITVDSAVTLPTVSQLDVGARAGSNQILNSTIKRLTFWPTRLADITLQQITQP